MDLEQTWCELEGASRDSDGGFHVRLLTPRQSLDIEAAVDGKSVQRLLMFRFPRAVLRPDTDIPESTGISVRQVVFDRDGQEFITIQLVLSDPRNGSIFTRVAEDLVNEVGTKADPVLALRTLIERLTEWHRFMRKQSPSVMSIEKQRGLFGELDFLRRYAIAHLGAGPAVAAWQGPSLGLHDFEFPAITVEVKTTVAGGPTEFRVSNERQLSDSGIVYLALYHPLFGETKESGVSLPDLIDHVRRETESDQRARRDLEEKLTDYGYFEVHRKEYAYPRYVERQRIFYRITSGFPRITEADVPLGVGSVTYSVATAACGPFEVPEVEITKRIHT